MHVVNTDYLELVWKHKFLSNCVKSNSAGVIILYNKQYNLAYKFNNGDGRQMIAAVRNEENKLILVNAYYPNDHK